MDDLHLRSICSGSFLRTADPSGLTLIVQGYVCGRIGVDEMKTPEDKAIGIVVAAILYLKGSAWGLAVGIILYILVCLGGEEK